MGCIYVLVDRHDVIFYVGQTKNFKQRLRGHKNEVMKSNKLWTYNKLRKEIRETGLTIESFIKVYEDNVLECDLDTREIHHISQLKSKGYKLTNLTNGGKGSSTFTAEIHKRCANSRKGQKRSEETKKRMSEARMGMKFSKAHKKNLSIARKKRITTEETKEKMSKSSKGKINISYFELIDPSGKKHVTKEGLTKFCEEHDLTVTNMHKVIMGQRNHHKGWTGKKIK